jgi:hypothetical protein
MTDPLSLTQAKRLVGNADTLCCARRDRPTSRRLSARSCRSTTGDAGVPPRIGRGRERLGRYSFLGVGPRRLLEVRDGKARIQERPVTVDRY